MFSAEGVRSALVAIGLLFFGAVAPMLDDGVDQSTRAFVVLFVVVGVSLAGATIAEIFVLRKRRLRNRAREISKGIMRIHRRERDKQAAQMNADPWKYDFSTSADLLGAYDEEYCACALAVFDELVKRGVADGNERWRIEHPTNPNGVRHAATIIGVAAEKL